MQTGEMLPRRSVLLAAAVTCAVLAVPAIASAEDFCVGAPAGCNGTPVPAGSLKAALTAAQTNGTDDRFFLAPGVFSADAFGHQSVERVQIIGAGRDKSFVRSTALAATAFTLGGNPASTISDLTVEPTGGASTGLDLKGTRAERASVVVPAGDSINAAVMLSGGAGFAHGVVAFDQYGWGVASADTGTITDSTVKAPNGFAIFAFGSDMTVRRSTLISQQGAVVAKGHMAISDTLIDMRGNSYGHGVRAAAVPAGGATVEANLDRLTIVGSTTTGTDMVGAVAYADGAGESATVHLRDSVMSGIAVPLFRVGANSGVANFSTDRSSYPSNIVPVLNSGPGALTEQRHLTVSPGFVNAAGSDFHLAADSPLVDAGTPGDLAAGTADRDGRPRASDGDGNCTHVPDIGAFELQGTAVRAVATAAAAAASTGQAVEFSAAGSCIPGPGTPSIGWSFDDGTTAMGAAVTHAFSTAGRHTATVTVSDGDGHQSQAGTGVDVTATAASPAATPVPAAAAAPVISELRVTPTRIKIGTLLPRLVRNAAKRPVGTIRFTLSKAATVRLRFAKVGKGGATPTVKTRVRIKAKPGVNRIRFAARLNRTVRLKPAAYRLTMVATDAAGAHSKPATVRFTAIRAQRR
jgi:hypothetical protein